MGIFFDAIRAIAFLSRIPVPSRYFDGYDGKLSGLARAFPLAGFAIALPAALLLCALFALHIPPLIAAILVLTFQTLVTGALHEDGLADCADGFWGSHDKARRLEIMKDSRVGAYGVIALILFFALRAAAIAALAWFTPLEAMLIYLFAEIMSRTTMLIHWVALPSARQNGLAANAGQPQRKNVTIAALICGLFALCLIAILPAQLVIGAIAIAIGVTYVTIRLANAKIDGHTGDTLGACQQCVMVAILTYCACLTGI